MQEIFSTIEIFKTSFPMALSAIAYFIMQSIDIIILSIYEGFDQIAYYRKGPTTKGFKLLVNNVIINSKQNKSTFGIPMVVGMKYRILDKLIFSFEFGARYTFTDEIDGNNMSNDDLNYNFGNINNDDWYMFSTFTVTYTFGRNPCYCNIGK